MQGTINGVAFSNGAPYQVDRPEAITGPISRVGYFMELHKVGDPVGQNQYVFASMDAFTQDLKKIGIPTFDTGAFFQQNVSNLSIASNVSGVVEGVNLGTGNIEFWPSNYAATKAAGSPANASDTLFDFGDSGGSTGLGHGSFQLHNFDIDGAGPGTAGQTVFSINRFNATTAYGIGIGNSPVANPDWTFNDNSVAAYDLRSVQVFVLPIPEPSSLALLAAGGVTMMRRRRKAW
jgi:sialate O-acetylesterase